MPELPEVETCRRGIEPHIVGKRITAITVRQPKLRWPIPEDFTERFTDAIIHTVTRRSKYLLLHTDVGTVLVHLGMSGVLRVVRTDTPLKKHDHVDIQFAGGTCLRYHDPRRFGYMLYSENDQHPLLAKLAPEPLGKAFTADYLIEKLTGKTVPIKTAIMNSQWVVGVGNIYANESLFLAGLSPTRPAGSLSPDEVAALVKAIRTILNRAITQGGTTLKDFTQADGKPGYFTQQLNVYGRGNQPCLQCGTLLKQTKLAGRQTVHCPSCQP